MCRRYRDAASIEWYVGFTALASHRTVPASEARQVRGEGAPLGKMQLVLPLTLTS